MSNNDTQDNVKPTVPAYMLTVISSLLFFTIFGIILYVAYIPTRPAPIGEQQVQERKTRLAELNAQQHEQLSTYGVINAQEKIVRIPIDEAIELTATEIQNTQDAQDKK